MRQNKHSGLRSCSLYDPLRGRTQEWKPKMEHLSHWLVVNGSVLAVLVTVGVAVLLVCCLECTHCDCRDKDEFFHRHES